MERDIFLAQSSNDVTINSALNWLLGGLFSRRRRYRGVGLVLRRMGSSWVVSADTILSFRRCARDGSCVGGFGCRLLVGIARKGVSIDSVLSHLDQSDDDNVELKIKTKVNSNCKL